VIQAILLLGQRRDNKSYVMYYARKTLDEAQMSYSIVKKKMLAMVFAVEQFFQYLLGSKVVVFTY